MKKITVLFLALAGLSGTAHAELTRSQITDINELRALKGDMKRMLDDEKGEEKTEGKIGLSATHESGAGTTLSVPFTGALTYKGKYSFSLSGAYDKEFNNGNTGKQGFEDLSLKFTNSDVLANRWNIHGFSYNVAATAPMNQVSSGAATQSISGGYKYTAGEHQAWVIQPLVKLTHYNSPGIGQDSRGKSFAASLTYDDKCSAKLSRKIRGGDAGLTSLDLGYENKFSDKRFSYEFGLSKSLTGAMNSSVSFVITRTFSSSEAK